MKADHLLRILFVEDLPSDTELAERELRKGEISFTSMRVETKKEFISALKDFRPDLIISDYAMPEFDGMQALKLSLKHDPDLPFILFTGSMNEETAVACMKAGAMDYIIKEHIRRLPMAVAGALEQKRAQLLKRETEREYRELFETIMDVFYRTDNEGRVLLVSPSLEKVLGYAPDEVIGKKTEGLYINPEEWHQFVSAIREKGTVKGFETALRAKDGSEIWVSTHAQFYRDEQGNILGVQGITRDVTERKLAEEALLKSEEKFRTVFDTASDGILIADAATKKFLEGNTAICSMLGYTKEEIEGLSVHDIHPPKDISRVLVEFEKQATGKKILAEDLPVLRKDGSIFYADVASSTTVLGETNCLVGIFRDITERKRMEEVLRERDIQFKKLSSWVPGMIYQFTRRSDGTYCVPFATEAIETLFGCSPQDVREDFSPIARAILPEDLDKVVDSIEYSARHLTIWTCEYKAQIPGQPIRWILGNSTPEKLADGSITWYGFNTDITNRKHAEKQLQDTLESLRNAVSTTIQVIISTVEARDPYTANHQIRSADLARAIATEMKLSQDRIEGIRIAGSIHDLGKLSIPAEILSKPTRLTEIEFSLIKEHPRKGYDILKNVESSWPLAEIIYQHHERMDGSGYPRNLKGDEILMEARILAVCDVVESMASHRPYRAALGINAALKEIEDNRGTLYDADVVDVCLNLFREKGYQFE